MSWIRIDRRLTQHNIEVAQSPSLQGVVYLILLLKEIGWGTWTRTKINGVRVRRSTIELFPNDRYAMKSFAAKVAPL